MRKAFYTSVIGLLLFAAPGRAQFGGIVFDPTNYGENVAILAQAVQTYLVVMRDYQLAQQMAMNIQSLPSEYQQTFRALVYMLTPNPRCPQCNVWANSTNHVGLLGMAGPASDYGGAVAPVQDPSRALSLMPLDAQQRFLAEQATNYYLPDAAARADLNTLSQVRANDPLVQQYTNQCLSDVRNASATTVSASQSAAACNALLAQDATHTNALLTRLVEAESIRHAQQMNAEIDRMNMEVVKTQVQQTSSSFTAGYGSALDNFRLW